MERLDYVVPARVEEERYDDEDLSEPEVRHKLLYLGGGNCWNEEPDA